MRCRAGGGLPQRRLALLGLRRGVGRGCLEGRVESAQRCLFGVKAESNGGQVPARPPFVGSSVSLTEDPRPPCLAARFLSQRTQGRRGGQLVSFETHKAVAEVRMSPWTATPIEASRVISVYHYALCLKRLLLGGFYAGV